MLAVRAGDLDPLGELFERHHRPLYGYLVRLTRDTAASEDIVQTVFHRILKYRHTYRDTGSFTAWAYHLARQCAADFFRKNKIAFHADHDTAALAELPGDEAVPADSAVRADDLALLQTALEQLPPAEREIIHLARIENLPHHDTAQILGCSEGAAKVRLHRALQLLRDTYQKLENGTARAATFPS